MGRAPAIARPEGSRRRSFPAEPPHEAEYDRSAGQKPKQERARLGNRRYFKLDDIPRIVGKEGRGGVDATNNSGNRPIRARRCVQAPYRRASTQVSQVQEQVARVWAVEERYCERDACVKEGWTCIQVK